jgi:hypothetical protein
MSDNVKRYKAYFNDGENESSYMEEDVDGEYVAFSDYDSLRAELEQTRLQLEQTRLQLAACGVVAMCNTVESSKDRIKLGDYGYSASYKDVCRAVDAEIALRTENDTLRES